MRLAAYIFLCFSFVHTNSDRENSAWHIDIEDADIGMADIHIVNDKRMSTTMTVRPCVRTQCWVRTKQGKCSVVKAHCGVSEWALPEYLC